MITTAPSTWNEFEEHPAFQEFTLSDNWKDWYEGDSPEMDLKLLQKCAMELMEKNPGTMVNLTLLDDLTIFVELSNRVVSGLFGIGCESGSLYLQVDTDTQNVNEDNLSVKDLIQIVQQISIG